MSRILAQPSLRERFDQMSSITTPAEMLLHSKFKQLANLFSEVDQMVFFLNGRVRNLAIKWRVKQQTAFFSVIAQNLQEAKKLNVQLDHVRQMLQVWPECYTLSWSKNEKLRQLDQVDLVLSQRLNQTNLDERKTLFRDKMFRYIQAHGDYIAEADLPLRPDERRVPTNSEYSLDKPPPTSVVQEVLQSLAAKDARLDSIDFSRIKSVSKGDRSKLSEKLLAIVRVKEEKLRCQSKQQQPALPAKQLSHLASQLAFYFQQRQVSNMFLASVVDYVHKTNKRSLLDQQQILAGISEQWGRNGELSTRIAL